MRVVYWLFAGWAFALATPAFAQFTSEQQQWLQVCEPEMQLVLKQTLGGLSDPVDMRRSTSQAHVDKTAKADIGKLKEWVAKGLDPRGSSPCHVVHVLHGEGQGGDRRLRPWLWPQEIFLPGSENSCAKSDAQDRGAYRKASARAAREDGAVEPEGDVDQFGAKA